MSKRGYKLHEFAAHTSNVNCLNIGKKSCKVFVTGGEDRKVNLWAIDKPASLLSLSGHTSSVRSVTFDSAEVLVLAGASSGTIKLWDLQEGKIVRTLAGHRSNCTSVEFHPFGEFFASGSLDTDLKIWDIRRKGCIHTYKGHTQGIRTIRFTPDGRWVVTGGEDNVVKLWDLTAGKLLHDFKFHNGLIRCIDFHPNEFLLATGSADRTVKFWDLETFELIGSAGPEATGVRSMIFHPDGRNLFCGLEETLKVFSWEPIRCHDHVDMGWSTLADLSIYEGKLLGCSYHESRVGVWVADISLIGPYAVGIMPKTNSFMEPKCNYTEDHSVEPIKSYINSSATLINGPQDSGSKTKEIARSPCLISSGSSQNAPQGIDSNYASNLTLMNSAGFQVNKGIMSCQNAPQKIDSKISPKVSTLNSTILSVGKATECSPSTPDCTESSFVSRNTSLNSSRFSGSSSLSLKKGAMSKMHTGTNISRPVSMPVIVPRVSPDPVTAGHSRKETATSETTAPGMTPCQPIHMRRPSYVGGGCKSHLIGSASGSLSGMTNGLEGVMDSNFLSRLVANGEKAEADEGKGTNTENIAVKFERSMSMEQPARLHNDAESLCSSSETSSVKYVKGVAVQLGKTRSLVESWERRERCNSGCMATISSSSDTVPRTDNSSSLLKKQVQTSERGLTSTDDDFVPEILLQNHDDFVPETLLQNHDIFINAVKSRLTKLQVVRHFWEQNGITGAIDAVAKLPDHSVQVDIISILLEKIDLFTLDLFTCLLPLLAGLLNSKTERHIIVSLEMLVVLVKIFEPVIRSAISASSLVGVDLRAEQRSEHCNQCFNQLEKIKQVLPMLIRRGGLLAKHAHELNLVLHES